MFRRNITGLVMFLCTCMAPQLAAEEIVLGDDGWYRWEVTAGKGGQRSCCYSYNNGNILRKGCRLGHGMDEFTITEPCEEVSDQMQIFVEVRNGRVREVRPLSSSCPVRSESEVITFNGVTETQSIAWLETLIEDEPRMADEAVMTLSFHPKDLALQSLFGLLEDHHQDQDAREQALFWLIQSDYDEAFAYLDRLLD